MLKRTVLIAIGMLAQGALVLAAAEGMLDTAPAPKQSYQQAGKPAAPQVEPPPLSEPTPPPSADPNIVNRTATPAAPPATTPAAPAPEATPNVPNVVLPQVNSNSDQPVKEQLTQLAAQMLQQAQQTQTQLSNVNAQLGISQKQIVQLQDRVKAVEAKFAAQSVATNPWLQKIYAIDQSVSAEMKLAFVAGLLLVAMLMGYMLAAGGRKRERVVATKPVARVAPATAQATHSGNTDTDSEYDFMSTTEAIPAKLDLARAYVAMEDYKSARSALEEVIAEGNAKQKDEAKEILANIPQA